jgi:hypothetical protein
MLRKTLCLAFAVILVPSPSAAQTGAQADIKASCRSEIQNMIKIGVAHSKSEGATPAAARQAVTAEVNDMTSQVAKLSRKEAVDGLAQLKAGGADPFRTPPFTCFVKRRLAQLDGAKLIH